MKRVLVSFVNIAHKNKKTMVFEKNVKKRRGVF
jgi:hypothetical protein